MSKSMYNVVNPDDIVEEYGADTLRLYEMFLEPCGGQQALGYQWHRRLLPIPQEVLESLLEEGFRQYRRRRAGKG